MKRRLDEMDPASYDSGNSDIELPLDIQVRIWRTAIQRENWTVEKAMEMAGSHPIVEYILKTDDALWRSWWLDYFWAQERELQLSIRGLPDWIFETKDSGSKTDIEAVKELNKRADDKYVNVPWRRMYAWTVFFQKRLARYVISLADKAARTIRAPQYPIIPGLRVVTYYPTYKLQRPHASSMRIEPYVTVSTTVPGQEVEEEDHDFISLLYPEARDMDTDLPPVWAAWHTINNEDDVGDIESIYTKLGTMPSTQDGDTPVVYNFPFLTTREYGMMMFRYIVWYVRTARTLLTEEEFARSSLTSDYVNYEEYTNDMTNFPHGSHQDLPENIELGALDNRAIRELYRLKNLPHAPFRKPAHTAKDKPTQYILFTGDPIDSRICVGCGVSEAIQQCSRCKTVAYCGKECQKEHWVNGGHREVCGSVRGEK